MLTYDPERCRELRERLRRVLPEVDASDDGWLIREYLRQKQPGLSRCEESWRAGEHKVLGCSRSYNFDYSLRPTPASETLQSLYFQPSTT